MSNGWFVFVLYGIPYSYASTTLSCLSEDGKDVPKVSCSEARAKEAKVEMEKRHANNAGKRGVSMQDQLTLATLSQAEFLEETKNLRELLAIANAQETNTSSALKLTCGMLEQATNSNEKKYHKKRKLDLLTRLEELEARKRCLKEENDRLREEQAVNKRKNSAIMEPPNHVRVSVDDTTMNSPLSHSGSSSNKELRRSLVTPMVMMTRMMLQRQVRPKIPIYCSVSLLLSHQFLHWHQSTERRILWSSNSLQPPLLYCSSIKASMLA